MRLGQLGGADLGLGQPVEDVVAVERDVDRAQQRRGWLASPAAGHRAQSRCAR